MNADQGCPGICHAGATLVGCLELVWARCLGITESVGWPACTEPCSYPCYHGGRRMLTMVLISLVTSRVPSAPLPSGSILRLPPFYSNRFFKPWLFPCAPEHLGLVWTRGPGLTEVAGQVWCPEPSLPLHSQVYGKQTVVHTSPSNLNRAPADLLFGSVLGLDLLYPSCSFKPLFFFCAARHSGLVWALGPRAF